MADKVGPKVLENRTRAKRISRAPKGISERGARKSFLDIIALIRSIQRAEGNPDCFRRFEGHCDQTDCAWRTYCLEGEQTSKGE